MLYFLVVCFFFKEMSVFFFFKQKTAYEISACLVGSEMCIRRQVFTWPANIDYVPTFAGIDHIVLDSGMLAGRVKSFKIDASDHTELLATVQFNV